MFYRQSKKPLHSLIFNHKQTRTTWYAATALALIFVLIINVVSYSLPHATWIEQAKLVADDAATFDVFGRSVSVSGDTVLVGATGDGSAYVFVRSSSGWSQQAKLTAEDAGAASQFGNTVALDDHTAVIGAYSDATNGSESGAAYVFVRDGTSWSQQEKLTADDTTEGDRFGFSVALDGDTLVVGAPRDDDSFSNSGAAYVFVRNGGSWSQEAKLNANDAAEEDEFGNAVAVNNNSIVVGAFDDDAGFSNNGSAYVFVRNGNSWSQQDKLTAEDATNFGNFGSSVAIDNDTVVIGAIGDNNSTGAAYVFLRDGSSWSQQAKLAADDGANFEQFGNSAAVTGDTAVIGARTDSITGYGNGSAYVFIRDGSSWSQQTKLVASDTSISDSFGQGVDLDGKTIIIGAPGNDDADVNSGSAYVFAIPAEIFIEDVIHSETDTGTISYQFTITRTDNLDAISIDFATSDGTATTDDADYIANAGTISFAVDGDLQKQITIEVIGDTKLESDETFMVTLSNIVGNATITDAQGIGTIKNDDELFLVLIPIVINN